MDRTATGLLAAALVLLFAAGGGVALATSQTDGDDSAAAYCRESGGVVRERYPAWATNSGTPLRLAGTLRFCEFTGGAGAEPPGSWIHVTLETLYAEQPTLAALAYLTKPPLPPVPASVNPASVYCTHLGGTDAFGGATGAGGGWVTDDMDTPIDVLQACVFPDLSSIDSWGLTYHTDGTIRGADLTPLFRYRPTTPPDVFPRKG
jgi:hypothetical protein